MMLTRTTLYGVGLATMSLCVVGLTGCDNKVKDENAMLLRENDALRSQLTQRNDALTSAEKERLAADARASDAERRLTEVESAPPSIMAVDVVNAGNTPFIDENITVNTTAEGLNMTIPGDVLFDSGKASLKSGAKKTLDKMIAAIKKDYSGNKLRVTGFTDDDPIKKSGFKSNYHLGFDRAWSVREYCTSNGLDGADIALASYGPQDPKATKAASRRVEVLVIR